MLQRIHRSRMSKISKKHGNRTVAHFSEVGKNAPLCKATLSQRSHWIIEGESMFIAVYDCKNCVAIAQRRGLRVQTADDLPKFLRKDHR